MSASDIAVIVAVVVAVAGLAWWFFGPKPALAGPAPPDPALARTRHPAAAPQLAVHSRAAPRSEEKVR